MARQALGKAGLKVVQALTPYLDLHTDSFTQSQTGELETVSKKHPRKLRAAVSGGADSMALAAGLSWFQNRNKLAPGTEVEAMIIDHQLQAESSKVASDTADQLAKLGIKTEIRKIVVPDEGEGVEAAARKARYQALTKDLTFSDQLLTGHTLDDQAETVLLGLARGSGINALSGMPALRRIGQTHLIRPLLRLRRAHTEQCCIEFGLKIWDDPTNSQEYFLRNRVRISVLPILEQHLGPGFAESLARTAYLLNQDRKYLDQVSAASYAEIKISGPAPQQWPRPGLAVDKLAELDPAIESRVIRLWASHFGVGLNFHHTSQIQLLIHDWKGQKGIQIPILGTSFTTEMMVVREGNGIWLAQSCASLP